MTNSMDFQKQLMQVKSTDKVVNLPAAVVNAIATAANKEESILHILNDWNTLVNDWLYTADANGNRVPRGTWKVRTVQTYEENIADFRGWLLSNDVISIDRKLLDCYKNSLINSKAQRTGKNLSVSSVNLHLSACRSFLNWLFKENLLAVDYSGTVRVVEKDTSLHSKSSIEESKIAEILDSLESKATAPKATLKDKRDYALFRLMVICGLRCIEITRANIEDIKQVAGKIYLFVQGKKRVEKKESVELPQGVLKAINDYLSARFCDDAIDLSKPLFESRKGDSRNGKTLSSQAISHIIKAILRKHGVDGSQWTAHSLRHTTAQLLIDEGKSLRSIQQILRHRNPATTQIYFDENNRLKNDGEASLDMKFRKK